MTGHAIPISVWLLPALAVAGAVVTLIADALGRRRLAVWTSAAGLLAAGIAGFWTASAGEEAVAFGTFASGAGFSGLAALAYVLGACAITAGAADLLVRDRGPATAAIVAVGAVFSHALMASLDVVVTFVAFAGLSVTGYALVGGSGTRRAEESAVRYLVQGVVASGIALYGFGVLFGLGHGQAAYAGLSSGLPDAPSRPVLLAFGLIVSALAFKAGGFPFHSWAPDVYETADDFAVAFLASGPKIAATVALLVLARFAVFGDAVRESALAAPLFAVAVGSMLFGTFGMIRQRVVARMLGYSAIANAGYAVAGIALGGIGLRAAVLTIVTYSVGACGSFAVLVAVRRIRPGWDGTLAGLTGLSREAPLVAASFAVMMLSLTGVPLFAGFWGKLMLLVSAIDAGTVWFAVLVGIAAVVSFASYGAVVRHAYFEADSSDTGEQDTGDGPERVSVGTRDLLRQGGAGAAVAGVLGVLLVAGGLVPLVWGVQSLYALFSLG